MSHMAIGNIKHVAEAIVKAWSRLLSWFWKQKMFRVRYQGTHKAHETKEKILIANYMNVTTLIETRLAITLLRADRIPAQIGTNICFKPKTCSAWVSDSSLSSHGKFQSSLQHLWWKKWKRMKDFTNKKRNTWSKRFFSSKISQFRKKITQSEWGYRMENMSLWPILQIAGKMMPAWRLGHLSGWK